MYLNRNKHTRLPNDRVIKNVIRDFQESNPVFPLWAMIQYLPISVHTDFREYNYCK